MLQCVDSIRAELSHTESEALWRQREIVDCDITLTSETANRFKSRHKSIYNVTTWLILTTTHDTATVLAADLAVDEKLSSMTHKALRNQAISQLSSKMPRFNNRAQFIMIRLIYRAQLVVFSAKYMVSGKSCHSTFASNFTKGWPICKILSQVDLAVNFWQGTN